MSDIGNTVEKGIKAMVKEIMDHCAGRLDKDELAKLREIIDQKGGDIVSVLEHEIDQKGISGSGSVAMDRAPRSFSSTRSAVQEIQAIDAAMRECAAHLGGRVIAYDCAGAVYKEALISMGYRDRLKGITTNGKGFQGIYRLAVQPGGPGPSRLAMDSATSDFNSRFPNATKLVGGTGRI